MDMKDDLEMFLYNTNFYVSKHKEDTGIIYQNTNNNNTVLGEFSIDIKDGKLDITALELVNQNPYFFIEILQDKYLEDRKGETVNYETEKDIQQMQVIADIALERSNNFLLNEPEPEEKPKQKKGKGFSPSM